MKKIIDNIILGLYYIGCIMAFFLFVCELPNLLNELFDTEIFKNTTTFSFLFCTFILGYSLIYLDNLNHIKK